MTLTAASPARDDIVATTRTWIERAVIGLNLCPFARAAYSTDRVRFSVSSAHTSEDLRNDILDELCFLAQVAPTTVETTLLIHPDFLNDFGDYNAFLSIADAALQSLHLEGVLQIASFHPAYQFADTTPEDVTNCTNRSPYPMLHLLREASVAAAIAAFPDTASIYQRNIATLRQLGANGWSALTARP